MSNREFLAFVRAQPQWRKSRIQKTLHDGDYLKHWINDETVPPEELDQPVRYVSHFAAHAYCAAQGHKLPTLSRQRIAAQSSEGNTIQITYAAPYQAPDWRFMSAEWSDAWWHARTGAPDAGKRIPYEHGTRYSDPPSKSFNPDEDRRYTGRALGFRCAAY